MLDTAQKKQECGSEGCNSFAGIYKGSIGGEKQEEY